MEFLGCAMFRKMKRLHQASFYPRGQSSGGCAWPLLKAPFNSSVMLNLGVIAFKTQESVALGRADVEGCPSMLCRGRRRICTDWWPILVHGDGETQGNQSRKWTAGALGCPCAQSHDQLSHFEPSFGHFLG